MAACNALLLSVAVSVQCPRPGGVTATISSGSLLLVSVCGGLGHEAYAQGSDRCHDPVHGRVAGFAGVGRMDRNDGSMVMENPKCPECGNRRKFVHRTVEYEICYYDSEDGLVTDSKSLEIDSSVVVSCGECGYDMSDD